MNFENLRKAAFDNPNPFKVGDKVVCTDNSNGYNRNLILGDEYTVTHVHDVFIDVKGRGSRDIGALHSRFEKAKVPDDTTGAAAKSEVDPERVDALLREYSKRLDQAIANGTMVPHLSSLGLLTNLLIDYTNLTKD